MNVYQLQVHTWTSRSPHDLGSEFDVSWTRCSLGCSQSTHHSRHLPVRNPDWSWEGWWSNCCRQPEVHAEGRLLTLDLQDWNQNQFKPGKEEHPIACQCLKRNFKQNWNLTCCVFESMGDPIDSQNVAVLCQNLMLLWRVTPPLNDLCLSDRGTETQQPAQK